MRKIKLDLAAWIAILRVAVGLIWLYSGVSKVLSGFSLVKTVQYFASNNPYPFYQSFINSVVIPNSNIFSIIIPYGEILVGILLTLGILAKPSSFLGILMNVNYFFAAAWTGVSTGTLNLLMILLQIVFIFTMTKFTITKYVKRL